MWLLRILRLGFRLFINKKLVLQNTKKQEAKETYCEEISEEFKADVCNEMKFKNFCQRHQMLHTDLLIKVNCQLLTFHVK